MEKIIYKNKDVSELFKQKENDIIELYARKKHKSFAEAQKTYNESKLKNVMDDLDNELWLESEYYILDSYEKLMEKCPVVIKSVEDSSDSITVVADSKKYKKTFKPSRTKKNNPAIISMFDKLPPAQQRQIEKRITQLAYQSNIKIKNTSKTHGFGFGKKRNGNKVMK